MQAIPSIHDSIYIYITRAHNSWTETEHELLTYTRCILRNTTKVKQLGNPLTLLQLLRKKGRESKHCPGEKRALNCVPFNFICLSRSQIFLWLFMPTLLLGAFCKKIYFPFYRISSNIVLVFGFKYHKRCFNYSKRKIKTRLALQLIGFLGLIRCRVLFHVHLLN